MNGICVARMIWLWAWVTLVGMLMYLMVFMKGVEWVRNFFRNAIWSFA